MGQQHTSALLQRSAAALLLLTVIFCCPGHFTILASLRHCLQQAGLTKQLLKVASEFDIYSSNGYTSPGSRLASSPIAQTSPTRPPSPPPQVATQASPDEAC